LICSCFKLSHLAF